MDQNKIDDIRLGLELYKSDGGCVKDAQELLDEIPECLNTIERLRIERGYLINVAVRRVQKKYKDEYGHGPKETGLEIFDAYLKRLQWHIRQEKGGK